jgi:hypothetical protein
MQSRLQSAVETVMNYVVGFGLAWPMNKYVLRWLGFHVSNEQATGLTLLFTAVSVIRSFAIRRFFNWFNARPTIKGTLIHPYDRKQYRE